jgi:hypothetical protein
LSNASSDKVIVVSADCHADPAAVDAFGPYLERKYQARYREYVKAIETADFSRASIFSKYHVTKLRQATVNAAVEGGATAAVGTSLSRTRVGRPARIPPLARSPLPSITGKTDRRRRARTGLRRGRDRARAAIHARTRAPRRDAAPAGVHDGQATPLG